MKLVYYNKNEWSFREIDEKYVISAEAVKDYFGYIDDHLDSNGEMVIYELVPYQTIKKDVKYKFKENE